MEARGGPPLPRLLRPFVVLMHSSKLMRGRVEARGGIEPPIKVLQTFALPLGDRASIFNAFYQMFPCIVFLPIRPPSKKNRGG